MTRLLIVPGLSGSGPEHWQSAWERLDARCRRVQQSDWEKPDLSAWMASLEQAVSASSEPAVLVAHSLGAALVAHWGQSAPRASVLGALLVAPADVDSLVPGFPDLASFAPLPRGSLGFPSLVVASRNDPYVSIDRAEALARAWGSRFVDLGLLGHINADSCLGTWPAGRELLAELLNGATFDLDPRLAGDTVLLAESELGLLLLMNERRYPWLILVPKRAGITELDELSNADRRQLSDESSAILTRPEERVRRRQDQRGGARQRGPAVPSPSRGAPTRGSGLARTGVGPFAARALRRHRTREHQGTPAGLDVGRAVHLRVSSSVPKVRGKFAPAGITAGYVRAR
ncbi:MAG: alpha/beta hydrolase [Myxococcales bacterium]